MFYICMYMFIILYYYILFCHSLYKGCYYEQVTLTDLFRCVLFRVYLSVKYMYICILFLIFV